MQKERGKCGVQGKRMLREGGIFVILQIMKFDEDEREMVAQHTQISADPR